MSKVLAVFGATGNQGGSVIKAVLDDATLSKEFKIRAITRDVSKPAAKDLAAKGIEVVAGDLSSPASLSAALRGAHTVFLVTNFWETVSMETEIAQGKAAADAAKAEGVKHFIFSSLLNVTKASGGKLPNIFHFDGKAEIEDYIRKSGVPATFVLAGMFMTGFLDMIRKNEEGGYTLALPVTPSKATTPLFDVVADTGKFVKAAIKHFPATSGKQILAATDYYPLEKLVAEFSEVLGKPAQVVQIPDDTFKSFFPAPVAQEVLENMKLLEAPGYYGGEPLAESLALLDEPPVQWKTFVQENKEKWL